YYNSSGTNSQEWRGATISGGLGFALDGTGRSGEGGSLGRNGTWVESATQRRSNAATGGAVIFALPSAPIAAVTPRARLASNNAVRTEAPACAFRPPRSVARVHRIGTARITSCVVAPAVGVGPVAITTYSAARGMVGRGVR